MAGLRRAPGFELAELNLLDAPGARAGTLAGLDAVCHLAGRPGRAPRLPGDLRGRQRAHHRGRDLAAAGSAGVRRVLLASSSSVYGPRGGPGGRGRPAAAALAVRALEAAAPSGWPARLAAALGIELVVLRYFTVYGPRQRPDMAFARFVSRGRRAASSMPLLGDGGQVRDFTYVGDAAAATALAVERGRDGGDLQRGRRQRRPRWRMRSSCSAEQLGRAPALERRARGRARSRAAPAPTEPGPGRPRLGARAPRSRRRPRAARPRTRRPPSAL